MINLMQIHKTEILRGDMKCCYLPETHALRVTWEHGKQIGFLGMNFHELLDALSRAAQDAQRAPRLTCDFIEYNQWDNL